MKFYEVMYNSAVYGPSNVLVIAKSKRSAIKLAIKEVGIRKSERPHVYAKLVSKQYPKGLVIL